MLNATIIVINLNLSIRIENRDERLRNRCTRFSIPIASIVCFNLEFRLSFTMEGVALHFSLQHVLQLMLYESVYYSSVRRIL